MLVLITGSSGAIGTNLALRLCLEGIQVLGVDKRANPWTKSFDYLVEDLTSFDLGKIISSGKKIDLVVHLAANAKVHASVLDPSMAFENMAITLNVLEYCRKNNTPIILASSREVYGNIKTAVTEETQAELLSTESPYSASKVASEVFVYAYSRSYGLPYIVFRFSNVYGRFDNDIKRMERVIPLFIKKIASGEKITIYGKDKVLDFTYIDDCVEGIFQAINRLVDGSVKNETINLAYGKGHSLTELVTFISSSLNKKFIEIEIKPSRTGEVTRYVASIAKASRLLGYSPQTSLEKGIVKTIENHSKFKLISNGA